MSLNLKGYFKIKRESMWIKSTVCYIIRLGVILDLSHFFNPTSYLSTKQIDYGLKTYLWNYHFSTPVPIFLLSNEQPMQMTLTYMLCIQSCPIHHSPRSFKIKLVYIIILFKHLKCFLFNLKIKSSLCCTL